MPKPSRQTYSYVEEWRSRWEPEMEAIAYNGATCDPTRVDPKVLQWVKQNCHDKPHFVKIINPNAAQGKPGLMLRNSSSLTVPSPFVREHYRRLERVVTLENDGGRKSWRVSFGAPKRDPQWLQGWDRVAADNKFKPDDVVVFVLVATSRFSFTHFDADGNLSDSRSAKSGLNDDEEDAEGKRLGTVCSSQESHDQTPAVSNLEALHATSTKTTTTTTTTTQKKRPLLMAEKGTQSAPDDELVVENPIVTDPIAESPSRKESRLRFDQRNPTTPRNRVEEPKRGSVRNKRFPQIDQSYDPFGFTIKSKRRQATVVENQRAIDAAMAHAGNLTQHHFVAVMSDTHVYYNFHLVLPESFVTKACLPMTTTSPTRLILEDAHGNPCDMFVKKNKYGEVVFHRKFWAFFALHHLLEEGDVCVFHLKDDDDDDNEAPALARTVVVTTFRVVPISDHGIPISLHDHFAFHKLIGSATEPQLNPT